MFVTLLTFFLSFFLCLFSCSVLSNLFPSFSLTPSLSVLPFILHGGGLVEGGYSSACLLSSLLCCHGNKQWRCMLCFFMFVCLFPGRNRQSRWWREETGKRGEFRKTKRKLSWGAVFLEMVSAVVRDDHVTVSINSSVILGIFYTEYCENRNPYQGFLLLHYTVKMQNIQESHMLHFLSLFL